MDYTVEQLATLSAMSVRNIRAHQARLLLHPPQIRGRVGYYDDSHVERLALIAQLQAEGFTLDAIRMILSRGAALLSRGRAGGDAGRRHRTAGMAAHQRRGAGVGHLARRSHIDAAPRPGHRPA